MPARRLDLDVVAAVTRDIDVVDADVFQLLVVPVGVEMDAVGTVVVHSVAAEVDVAQGDARGLGHVQSGPGAGVDCRPAVAVRADRDGAPALTALLGGN